MRKTLKQKGKEFIQAFDNIPWQLDYHKDRFGISANWHHYQIHLYLNARPDIYSEENNEINEIQVSASVTVSPIEHIIKGFNWDYGSTSFILESASIVLPYSGDSMRLLGDNQYNYWDDLLPIWTRQYHEEIVPRLKRFRDLKEIHENDIQFGEKRSVFSGWYALKRLIVRKLISQELYLEYRNQQINRYKEFLKETEAKDYTDIVEENTKLTALILYLDTLDVDNYLQTMPWLDAAPKNVQREPSSIMTQELAMIVIDNSYDVEQLGQLLEISIVGNGEDDMAGAAASLSQSTDLHVMTRDDSTIIFLDDVTAVPTWDWSRISSTNRVMAFMIMETATHSYMLEYWQHGECLLRRMEIDNEERIMDEGTNQVEFRTLDVRSAIDKIFENLSGRTLADIKDTETVTRYTIKGTAN